MRHAILASQVKQVAQWRNRGLRACHSKLEAQHLILTQRFLGYKHFHILYQDIIDGLNCIDKEYTSLVLDLSLLFSFICEVIYLYITGLLYLSY